MTSAQKFTISLLLSTVLFGIFAFFAFSEVFNFIETRFFSARVVEQTRSDLGQMAQGIQNYRIFMGKELRALAVEPALRDSFSPTSSREAIQTRYNLVKLFLARVRGGGEVRIVDPKNGRIHFSTVESDVLQSEPGRSLTYKNLEALEDGPDLTALAPPAFGDQTGFWVQPGTRNMLFSVDISGSLEGTGLLVIKVSLDDLRNWLIQKGQLSGTSVLFAQDPTHWVVSGVGALNTVVQKRIAELWALGTRPPVENLANSDQEVHLVLVNQAEGGLNLSMVLPEDQIRLNDLLKAIILGTFYTVLFLLVFLILNLRGDSSLRIAKQIRRFHLEILQEYLGRKANSGIDGFKSEMEANSQRIRDDIRKGLGRIAKKDRAFAEEQIDKTWKELLGLLTPRPEIPESQSSPTLTVERVEALIKEALNKGAFVISAGNGQSVPSRGRKTPAALALEAQRLAVSDQTGAEQEAEEAEEVAELEDVEELEEVDELEEAVEELEPAELGDTEAADSVEELESVDDAEPVEELEAVADAEPVAEVESLEELDGADEMADNSLVEDEGLEELEVLESAPDGTLAEVQGLDHSESYFPYQPGFMGKSGTDLPMLEPEDEAVEELEELSEDSLTGPVPAARMQSDWALEVKSFALPEVAELFGGSDLAMIEDESGVVQLSDDLFTSATLPKNQDFSALVGEVLGTARSNPVFEGLDDHETARPRWQWTREGFNLDETLKVYPQDNTGVYKCLMDLTKNFEAFAGAILEKKGADWVAHHSVGFSDSGKQNLVFSPETGLYQACLTKPAVSVLNGEPGRNRLLYQTLHAKDLKFIKAVAILPVVFEGREAFLFLGMKRYPAEPLVLFQPRELE